MGGPARIGNKKYQEFDNFYPCEFYMDGILWKSSEQYFQAQKCNDGKYQLKIHQTMNASEAWSEGQKCPLREDWENIKYQIMFRANMAKISQNSGLVEVLIKTDGDISVNRSTPFWNDANACILEQIRDIFRILRWKTTKLKEGEI